MPRLSLVLTFVVCWALAGTAEAAFLLPVDAPIGPPRAMPHVAAPIGFTLPDGCAFGTGGQAVRTGENGSLIHWIAACPGAAGDDLQLRFARSLVAQGWTETTSERPNAPVYFRDDLEIVLSFTAASSVWLGQRYWR